MQRDLRCRHATSDLLRPQRNVLSFRRAHREPFAFGFSRRALIDRKHVVADGKIVVDELSHGGVIAAVAVDEHHPFAR